MKKVSLLIAAGLLLAANAAFADTKIGVLDLNKVLSNDPQVTLLQDQLKKQFEPRNQEIVTAQKNLQNDIDKYNKDSGKIKGNDVKKNQDNIIAEQKKLRDMQASFQHDLTDAQNKSMQTILKRVETVVNKIAADQKYDLVVTKVSTVYNDPKLEITDKVVTELKKEKI
ncbi:MAG: hypothetical protein A2X78_02120 [Gammaproteobacteria bacterium GWE2_37_16]|nr:MAG: hypothetical protein A2X78_02120 [Gammaproteobacteria bacterium GWE2_37_16]